MIKKVKPSKPLQELSKDRTWHDCMHPEAFELFYGNNERIERLIYTLYKWAESDDALDITQFCMEYKIPRQSFYDLRNSYPELKQAIDNVKIYLGCRKRVGAIKRIYDKEAVYKDMHKYDQEYDEINKYWAILNKQDSEISTDKVKEALEEIRRRFGYRDASTNEKCIQTS